MNHNYIIWEDHAIEAEAAKLPDKMRELYVWLKTYTRDQCGRDLNALVGKLRPLGVTTDITNWSRILKGRWNLDTNNEECTPCISEKSFINNVTAVKEHIRLEVLEGAMPFVETSIWNTIRLYVEKKRRKDRVNRFGQIIGPTGLQKTASYKELAQRDRMIKWLEAPDNGSIGEFVSRLCMKVGGGNNLNYRAARNKLFQNLTREHCVIVDNTQDLVREAEELKRMGKTTYKQPAYDFMRSLQDETGCTIIWSITPDKEEQMFNQRDISQMIYNEQFEGRFGGLDGALWLPNYSPKKDVIMFAEELSFQFDPDKHGERLHEISKERGRIRRYLEILQEAQDLAKQDGARPSMKHIELVMTRIAEDAARRSAKKGGRL